MAGPVAHWFLLEIVKQQSPRVSPVDGYDGHLRTTHDIAL